MGDNLKPVLTIEEMREYKQDIREFIERVLVEGVDYGYASGQGDSQRQGDRRPVPTLLQPGAEKFAIRYGLQSRLELVRYTEDWDGVEFGMPFFAYFYHCNLVDRDGRVVGGQDGSCNSREVRYRYRVAGRACPECGQATIFKSKNEDAGWFCWVKRGGCGATFGVNDERIVKQEIGRVENPDVADQQNTIRYIAGKRAFVSAVKTVLGLNQHFTVDLEDLDGGTGGDLPKQSSSTPVRSQSPSSAPHSTSGGQAERVQQAKLQGVSKEWNALCVQLAAQFPGRYAGAGGKFNGVKILADAKAGGFDIVNGDNLATVKAKLIEIASASAKPPTPVLNPITPPDDAAYPGDGTGKDDSVIADEHGNVIEGDPAEEHEISRP